jgi:hypothetical protein
MPRTDALAALTVARQQIAEAEKWLARSDDLNGQLRALDLITAAVDLARERLSPCATCDGTGEVTVVGWSCGPNPKRRPCATCR